MLSPKSTEGHQIQQKAEWSKLVTKRKKIAGVRARQSDKKCGVERGCASQSDKHGGGPKGRPKASQTEEKGVAASQSDKHVVEETFNLCTEEEVQSFNAQYYAAIIGNPAAQWIEVKGSEAKGSVKASQSDKNATGERVTQRERPNTAVVIARVDKHIAQVSTAPVEEEWPALTPTAAQMPTNPDTEDKGGKARVPHAVRERPKAWAGCPIHQDDPTISAYPKSQSNLPQGDVTANEEHDTKRTICTFWLKNRCSRLNCQFLHATQQGEKTKASQNDQNCRASQSDTNCMRGVVADATETTGTSCTGYKFCSLLDEEFKSISREVREEIVRDYQADPHTTTLKWEKCIQQKYGVGPCRCKACLDLQGQC